MSALNLPILVLNKHYVAIHVATVRQAVRKLSLGICDAVDEEDYMRYTWDEWVELPVEGNQDFIKTTARIVGQTMVLNEDVTLRATLEGGALSFLNGQESRAIDRFNQQVIRGFEAAGMGPTEGGEHLGGDYFAALKLEAEFPLGLPVEYGISGGAFYDIGAIWGVDTSNAVGPIASKNFKDRHVIGLSLFWESPFGPLRMNFSKALESEPGDIEQSFDLTVRTEF